MSSDQLGIREEVAAKVLVIDDEAPIRLLCRVNLEAEGMDVIEAEDGTVGVELARSERPDVILLDVRMPGIGLAPLVHGLLERVERGEGEAIRQERIAALRDLLIE
jgi:CheY-like chemotaxis protein